MTSSVLIAGPAGTVRDLLAALLAVHGVTVKIDAAAASFTDVALCVSPRPEDWELAGRCAGAVLVADHEPMPAEIIEAVMAGADAVVSPDVSPAGLLDILGAVAAGQTLLDPRLVRRLAATARDMRLQTREELALTPREESILESARRGESVKQTARSLGIAAKTVENLQSRLFRKLGARNRAHAVVLAHQYGLLPHHVPGVAPVITHGLLVGSAA